MIRDLPLNSGADQRLSAARLCASPPTPSGSDARKSLRGKRDAATEGTSAWIMRLSGYQPKPGLRTKRCLSRVSHNSCFNTESLNSSCAGVSFAKAKGSKQQHPEKSDPETKPSERSRIHPYLTVMSKHWTKKYSMSQRSSSSFSAVHLKTPLHHTRKLPRPARCHTPADSATSQRPGPGRHSYSRF